MNRSQRGIALVTALIVATLAAMIAAALVESTDLAIGQARSRQDYAQALALARGGIDYARAVLAEDSRRSSFDHLGEPWATPVPAVKIDLGALGGSIEDVQGRFNLNRLVVNGRSDPAAVDVYRRLLGSLALPRELAEAAADWIDADAETAAGGAERDVYATRNPPYVPADRPLTDFANLSRVAGYDPPVMERLRPYVSVLPGQPPVNVNIAPAAVLAAVIPGLGLAEAQRLAEERTLLPFRDLGDFRTRLPAGADGAAARIPIGVTSEFFIVHVVASSGQASVRQHALLQRRPHTAWPVPVWQTLQ